MLLGALQYFAFFLFCFVFFFSLKLQVLQLHYMCKNQSQSNSVMMGKKIQKFRWLHPEDKLKRTQNTVKCEIAWVLAPYHCLCASGRIVFQCSKMMSEEENRKTINIQRQTGFLEWCINNNTSLFALTWCARIWTCSSCLSVRLRQYDPLTSRLPVFSLNPSVSSFKALLRLF